MEKVKEWLKPTKNKVIAGMVTLAVVVAGGFGIYALTKPSPEPIVVFKENIVLEYGRTSLVEETDNNHELTEAEVLISKPITVDEIVNVDESTYDEISFNKIGGEGDNTPTTLEFAYLEANEVGKGQGVVYARLGEVVKEFTFDYEIKDTNKPIITGIEEITIEQGSSPDYSKIKAHDIVDGDLEVTIDSSKVDIEIPGTYEVVVSALDKNGNETKETLNVIVKEKEVAVVEETPVYEEKPIYEEEYDGGYEQTPSGNDSSSGENTNSGDNSNSSGNTSNGGGSNNSSGDGLASNQEPGNGSNGCPVGSIKTDYGDSYTCGGEGKAPWE